MRINSLVLARYLANEVAYRGFREQGAIPFMPTSRRSSRVKVSVLKANVLSGVLFSMASISASAIIATGNLYGYALSTTVLTGVAIAMALMYIIPFTSTVLREGIVDLLRLLPLSPKEVLKTYLLSMILYWGGLAITFIYVPYIVVSTYFVIIGKLSVVPYLLTILAAIATLAFSFLLGIALGTYSYLVRRRALFRYVSAIAWALVFLITYVMISITGYISKLVINTGGSLGVLSIVGPYIPFIGPLYAYLANPVLTPLSITETLAITLATYFVAKGRLSKVFIYGGEYVAPTKPTKVITPKAPLVVSPKPPLLTMIRKDLKLLSREPRRLAGVIILIIFPLVMTVMGGFTKTPILSATLVTCFVGAFSGLGVENLYYVEGEGALVLYTLPIRKRDVVLSKSLATSSITAPMAFAISLIYSLIKTVNPLISLVFAIVAAILSISYALINSSLMASLIPKEPSYWNDMTFRRSLGLRIVRSALALIGIGVSVAIPLVIMLLGLGGNVAIIIEVLAIYSLITLCAGLVLMKLIVGEGTLSD